MSEDVSAMIRVGVTVILVAALVAVVLNLLVIAQSTMSSGMSKLQSGVSQISLQEFSSYNQKKVSGIEVSSALTLYSGRDIAILVATNSCIDASGKVTKFYNYGALINTGAAAGGGTGTGTSATTPTVTPSDTTATSGVWRADSGDSYWTGEYSFKDTNSGIINTYGNTKKTTISGDEYILPSGKFFAELIKNKTGEIIGITFTQQK